MVDKKQFAIGFMVFFVVLTIYTYLNNDAIANIIANNGMQGMIYYFVTNASYVLLLLSIILINSEINPVRNVIGALMLITAFDIVSYPRFSPIGMPQDLSFLASSDGIILNHLISSGINYSTAYNLFYLILPLALVVGALAILGL